MEAYFFWIVVSIITSIAVTIITLLYIFYKKIQVKNIKLQEELKINDEQYLNRRKTDLINEFSGNLDYLIDDLQDKTSMRTKDLDSGTVSENRVTLINQTNLERDLETYGLQNQENEAA